MELDSKNLRILLDSELKSKLVKHHLDSANAFYKTGIKQITTDTFEIKVSVINDRKASEEDRKIQKVLVDVEITNIMLKKPETRRYKSGKSVPLTPKMARLDDLTYSSPLKINAKVTAVAHLKDGGTITKTGEIKDFRVSGIPTMVRSEFCNTYGMSRQALIDIGEDPTDPGGNFIVKGVEWVIDNLENIKYNEFHAHHNVGHKNEIARGEMISKPGDAFENSSEIIMTLLTNGQLVCRIINQRMHAEGKELEIPFYAIFRALGMTSDREMILHIVLTMEGDISQRMQDTLENAMRVNYPQIEKAKYSYSQLDTLKLLGETLDSFKNQYEDNTLILKGDAETKENKQKYITNTLLDTLDRFFIPHMGISKDHRNRKLRFFAHLIHKLLLVEMDLVQGADRDSYHTKRIHPTGVSYSKAFKTQFNFAVVQPIKRHLIREIKNTQFNNIHWGQVVMQSVNGTDFEKALVQAITSSDSKLRIQRKVFTNHLSAQMLHRKNPLNVLSTLRQITSPTTSSSKASERADEMRRVHSSYTGYVCVVQSADTGEKVGMQKQMAVSASITSAGFSFILKQKILDDTLCIKLDDVSPEDIHRYQMAKILVNGELIGLTQENARFVRKYRDMRRKGEIDRYATIYWDFINDEINLWVDVGRIIRPLLIVYSTEDPHPKDKKHKGKSKVKFDQHIKLTAKHLNDLYAGVITISHLVEEGVIEYINPEEQQTLLLAQSYDHLLSDRGNKLLQYTHCDIPQSIVGIAALTSPYSPHNQLARVCFQTNQVKQTCSWFALNWRFRADKETFLQYHNESPLVRTMANNYINPSGLNVIVAVMFYGGYNQEDSLIFNGCAIKRGLYTGSYFSFERTELDRNEEFATPNIADTTDIKANANYEKIKDGMISIGTTIKDGDVIIGKRTKVSTEEGSEYPYVDRSIVYHGAEESIVENVINSRNQADNAICKVIYRSVRPVTIGDKFCLTSEHEVLTSIGWVYINKVTVEMHVATMDTTDFVLYYSHPTDVYTYNHIGIMHSIVNPDFETICTPNHKLFTKGSIKDAYTLQNAQDLYKTKYYCKNNAINSEEDIEIFTLPAYDHQSHAGNVNISIPALKLPMDAWLHFLGIYISTGTFDVNQNRVYIYTDYIIDVIDNISTALGFIIKRYQEIENCYCIDNMQLCNYLMQFGNTSNKFLPLFVWGLSQRQSKLLLTSINRKTSVVYCNNIVKYYTESKQMADDIQRLCLHAGVSCKIIMNNSEDNHKSQVTNNTFCIHISDTNEFLVGGHIKTNQNIINYNGFVHCIEIPCNNIFYVRLNGKPHWTGNSSRAGQKGICGMTYSQADMPFTASGIVPSIIMNPHAMPSRMTIGMAIEQLMAKVCAVSGFVTDATMFNRVDIDSIGDKLEELGFDRHGEEEMYNGKTGEKMKAKIFIAPCYYQRLQKFVADAMYAVSSGPTCAITRQPVGGKATGGGLRLGEMERDVCVANGVVNFLQEKFLDHSDGFTIHICARCGSRDSVIVNDRKSIFKCTRCKDLADIVRVPSAWSAKLFMQEVRGLNVGMRWQTKPPTFEGIKKT